MDDERHKYQHSALKWLYEMELLDDPQLINNLKYNIMAASKFKVKEVEFVMSQMDKKMLVWIELNLFYRLFSSKSISRDIYDILRQLLPNYNFRLITDKTILDLAVTKLKAQSLGGNYEVSNNIITSNNSSDTDERISNKDKMPSSPDLLSDKKE